MGQDDIGRERGQFRRVPANFGGIGCGPARIDAQVAADAARPPAPAPAKKTGKTGKTAKAKPAKLAAWLDGQKEGGRSS